MLDTYAYLLVLEDYDGVYYSWFTYQEFLASPDSGVAFTLKSTNQVMAAIYNELYLSEWEPVEIDKVYKPLVDRELILQDGQLMPSLIDFMKDVDSEFLEEECEELDGSEAFKDSQNKVYIVTFSITDLYTALPLRTGRYSHVTWAVNTGYLPTLEEIAEYIQPQKSKDLISVHNLAVFYRQEVDPEIRSMALFPDGSFVMRLKEPGASMPVLGISSGRVSRLLNVVGQGPMMTTIVDFGRALPENWIRHFAPR